MRITRRQWMASSFLATALAALAIAGCSQEGVVHERSIPVKQVSAVDQVKQLLEGYAKGTPVGSEIIGFGQMVEEAKKQDPAKGEIIASGLKEIEGMMNRQSAVPAKAKEILAKLQ